MLTMFDGLNNSLSKEKLPFNFKYSIILGQMLNY